GRREDDISHSALALFGRLRLEQGTCRAREHMSDILRIQHHRSSDVPHRSWFSRALLTPGHAVMDDQPPLRNADGRRAATNLGRLPRLLRLRHLAVPAEPGEGAQIALDGTGGCE